MTTASIPDSARGSVHEVVWPARRSGVRVSFGTDHRRSPWRTGDPAPVHRGVAAAADLVFAGEERATLLTGTLPSDPAELVPGLERAALAVPAVDSMGAGDAFTAGFLAGHTVVPTWLACLERRMSRTRRLRAAVGAPGFGEAESAGAGVALRGRPVRRSVGYRRIQEALSDRLRLGRGPPACPPCSAWSLCRRGWRRRGRKRDVWSREAGLPNRPRLCIGERHSHTSLRPSRTPPA